MEILENIKEILLTNSEHYLVLFAKSILYILIFRLINKLIILICTKRIKTSRKVFMFNQNVSIIINIITFIILFIVW